MFFFFLLFLFLFLFFFLCVFVFFFFQAEDGIRDRDVTGVQTVLFRSQGSRVGCFYGEVSLSWDEVCQSLVAVFSEDSQS